MTNCISIDGVVWNGGNNEEKEEVRQKRKPSESPEVRTENGGKQVKRKPNAQHYEMNSDEEEDMEFYTDSEEFNHEDTTQETLLQIEKVKEKDENHMDHGTQGDEEA